MDGMNNGNNGVYQSPNNNYQQQQYQQPQYCDVPKRNTGSANGFGLWLGLNIAQIVLCCCNCTNLICGGIGIYFAIAANNAYKCGNKAGADDSIRKSRLCFILGIVISIVLSIVGAITGLLGELLTSIQGAM